MSKQGTTAGASLLDSLRKRWARPSGVPSASTPLVRARLALTSSVAEALANIWLSLAMTSFGVPFGTKKPFQMVTS